MPLAIWRATVSIREVCLVSHVAAELALPFTAIPVRTSGAEPLLSRAAYKEDALSVAPFLTKQRSHLALGSEMRKSAQ